jgi:hypothetical protein
MFLASTLGKAKVVADAKTVVLIAASDSRPIGSQVKRRQGNRDFAHKLQGKGN